MPRPTPESPVALFLFAHQDDEFGVYSVIEDCRQNGQSPLFLYFTAGDFGGQSSEIRTKESLWVLGQFGVESNQIFFIGQDNGIPDGKLHKHLDLALSEAKKLIASFGGKVQSLYAPAWEGGHQDHDSVNLLARVLASDLNCADSAWQFSIYNSCGMPWIFFKVLSPLRENGAVLGTKISLSRRWRYLKYCLSYTSQAKTWLGLFPFVVINYLFDGRQKLQTLAISSSIKRPYDHSLLYERRNFCRYDDLAACGERFINEHLGVK